MDVDRYFDILIFWFWAMLTFGLGKLRAPVVAFLSWANTPQMVVANRKNPTVQRILKSLGVNV